MHTHTHSKAHLLSEKNIYKQAIVVGKNGQAFLCCQYLHEIMPTLAIENVEAKFPILKSQCTKAGIECYSMNQNSTMEYLKNIHIPTIVFSVGNYYIFPKYIFDNPYLTIINLHGGLLPKFPGRNAEAWAIYAGEKQAGFTWHYIDEFVDSGYMIAQDTVDILPTTTTFQLATLLQEKAITCFYNILPAILSNTANKIPLSTDQTTLKYASDVPNNGIFDLTWDYAHGSRFLRSMDFYYLPQFPNGRITINNHTYIWKKYLLDPTKKAKEFSYSFADNNLILQFTDGQIQLRKIKPIV